MTDGPSDSTASKAVSDPASSPHGRRWPAHPGPRTARIVTGRRRLPARRPARSSGRHGRGAGDIAAIQRRPSRSIQARGQRFRRRQRSDRVRRRPVSRRSESPARQDELHLVPGASIARGRYRLLVFHGGAPHLQFWQALDTALNRQVALTFVDPDGALPDDHLREILSRTMRLSRIDKLGIARILDVVHTGTGGLVVAEWVRGGSLQEVADTSPSAVGAARAMQTLAAAAEAAHHAGVALSIDHPSRVRVSIEGDVVLAFPATMPEATPEDDIRGIGAALYALLVNRWPLPESGTRSGMAPAPRDPAGQPLEPGAIDRDIPFQISAAAAHSIQGDGGIRSAATLLNLLQQATAVADRTELLGPIQDRAASATRVGPVRSAPIGSQRTARRRRRNRDDRCRRRRRRHRGGAAGLGLGAEPDVRRRRRPRQRPARSQRALGEVDLRVRLGGRQHRQAGRAPRCSPPAATPTTPARPGWRSTATRPPRGRPTLTTTPSRSRLSKAASA